MSIEASKIPDFVSRPHVLVVFQHSNRTIVMQEFVTWDRANEVAQWLERKIANPPSFGHHLDMLIVPNQLGQRRTGEEVKIL